MNSLTMKLSLGTLALGLTLAGAAQAAPITITANAADAQVASNDAINTTGTTARVGQAWPSTFSFVAVFTLPTLAPNTVFTGVTFSDFGRSVSSPSNGDLYGLGYRTSPTVLATDKFAGALDTTDATLIQDNFLNLGMTNPTFDLPRGTDAGGSANLTDYLNAQFIASATDRLAGPVYVFLRLSPSSGAAGGSNTFYQMSTANHATDSHRPKLTYDTALIPEPATLALMGLGGLLIFRRRRTQR